MLQAPDSAYIEVYVPARVAAVRTVVVFIGRSVEQYAFDDRDWRSMCVLINCAMVYAWLPGMGTPSYEPKIIRDAAAGGGEAVLRALSIAAATSGHPELERAKLVLFGHSAAGSFVVSFASMHPDRVTGVIRYHSVPMAAAIDTNRVATIPVLTIVGARDDQVGEADSRTLWKALRARGAPWAFVSHYAQSHNSVDGIIEAGPLMRDWIQALAKVGPTPETKTSVAGASRPGGWFVDDSTGALGPDSSFAGSRDRASWLPDVMTAFDLRRLAGACAPLPLEMAAQALGGTARVVSQSVNLCRFSSMSDPGRELVLAISRANSDAEALARVRASSQQAKPVASVGDGASFTTFEFRQQRCGQLIAARFNFIARVSACGTGFGTDADTAMLKPIAKRLLGAM